MIISIIQMVFILALLAGGASLGRISTGFAEAGVLGEVRLLASVAVAGAVVLVRIASPYRQVLGPRVRALVGGILLLHAYIALSWLWSDRVAFGRMQLYELGLLCLVLVVAIGLFRRDPAGAFRLSIHALFWSAVAFVCVSIVASGSLQGDLAFLGAGGIGSARVLGAGLLAATYLAIRSGNVIWLLPAPLMAAALLLSGSRAAVLALAVAATFLLLVRKSVRGSVQQPDKRERRWLQYAAVGGIAVVFFWSSFGATVLVEFVVSNIAPPATGDGAGLYLADRDVIFADAWSKFGENPILGLGVGSYLGPWGELYPHNLLLGLAVDGGLVALLLGCAILATGFLSALRPRHPEARGAVAVALFFLVASLFAGTYYDARLVWVFLLLACLMIGDEEDLRVGSPTLGTLRL